LPTRKISLKVTQKVTVSFEFTGKFNNSLHDSMSEFELRKMIRFWSTFYNEDNSANVTSKLSGDDEPAVSDWVRVAAVVVRGPSPYNNDAPSTTADVARPPAVPRLSHDHSSR